jgi:HK97 family phage major capsid protein
MSINKAARRRDLLAKARAHLRAGEVAQAEACVAEAERLKVGEQLDEMAPEPKRFGGVSTHDRTASPDYSAAFDSYLNRFNHGNDGSFEQSALVIASDPDGGYTVPADRRAEILGQLPALSEIVALVNRPPVERGSEVEWVRVQPHPDSPDIYSSAFVGAMVGEVTGGGAAQPSFGVLAIPMKKYRAQALMSRDLNADSEIDMNAFLMTDGAQNAALVRERQILVGTGVGNECRGVLLNGDILGVSLAGTTSHAISNTSSDLGSVPKLFDLAASVPAQYQRDPSYRWVMHPKTRLAIQKLLDGDGSLLLNKLRAEMPQFVMSEFMPDNASPAADVPLILAGPLSQIISPERTQISVQVLVEKYAEQDCIALILRQRFGVGVANPRAFRIGYSSIT